MIKPLVGHYYRFFSGSFLVYVTGYTEDIIKYKQLNSDIEWTLETSKFNFFYYYYNP